MSTFLLPLFNQVATQSSSRDWVDPVPDLTFKIVKVPGIEPATL